MKTSDEQTEEIRLKIAAILNTGSAENEMLHTLGMPDTTMKLVVLIYRAVLEELERINPYPGETIPYSGRHIVDFGNGVKHVTEKIDNRIAEIKAKLKESED